MLEERIAKGGQIVELFSHTQKKFRNVRRVLTRAVAAGKNDLTIIGEFLFQVRFQIREAAGIVADGKIDFLSLIPVEGCELIVELCKIFRTDTGCDPGDFLISGGR
jgi:hypothetical protein